MAVYLVVTADSVYLWIICVISGKTVRMVGTRTRRCVDHDPVLKVNFIIAGHKSLIRTENTMCIYLICISACFVLLL